MKKIIVSGVIAVLVILMFKVFYFDRNKSSQQQLTKIRIGWPISWIPVGSVTASMQHTNILNNEGLDPEFQKFNSGVPMIEAALAQNLDLIFVGHVPALSLLNKSDDWQIIARIVDGRACVIVPKDSSINNISDLKGKNFSVPFGTLNYMQALKSFKENGIDYQKDLNFKNIDAVEVANLIKKGNSKEWEIDASSLWDPLTAQLEEANLAKSIDEFRLDGVIVVSKKYYAKHPDAVKNFLKGTLQAYDYYNNNKEQANSWYAEDSGLNYSAAVLEKASTIERNNHAKNIESVSLTLEETDLDRIQSEADQGFELGIFKKQLNIKDIIDQTLVNRAEQEIESGLYSKSIKVTK